MSVRRPQPDAAGWRAEEARLGWWLTLPAIATIGLVAVVPIAWTLWESVHLHDLRMPWLGRPFVGPANYIEALTTARFREAVGHTLIFTVVTVTLELGAGLALALALNRIVRARGVLRTAVLLPWAVPTVVSALVWRFMFESPAGVVNGLLVAAGLTTAPPTWFADATAAWLPLCLADVWKTTPFVAVVLLAGLQGIDRSLYESAQVDGAGAWRQFTDVTLPLLKPALFVACLFRVLDAFRVFDVVYVMTGGGPGTATEPIALYTFTSLLQNLRFGYGSALSFMVFVFTFAGALACLRWLAGDTLLDRAR
ncbi:MAG: ABC transporter permease subunit [Luteitalea sp.]|nr:ABC transporter permease subunit [Luteitalea sp.]